MRNRRKHQQAQRRHALLTIDNVEFPVVGGLQYKIAHVVSRFRVLAEQPDNVLPQVIPFVEAPGIVSLEHRYAIAQPIAHQLAKGGVGSVEIHTRKTFITSSPRWLMTLTAMRPVDGFSNGREVSLLSEAQASWLISALRVVLSDL